MTVTGTESPRWMRNQATTPGTKWIKNLLSLTQDFDAWWAYFFVALVPFLEGIGCPLEQNISMIASVVPLHPTNACCDFFYISIPSIDFTKAFDTACRTRIIDIQFQVGTASRYLRSITPKRRQKLADTKLFYFCRRYVLPFLIQELGAECMLSVVAWILSDTDTALQLKMNFIVKFWTLFWLNLVVAMINNCRALMVY